MPERDQFPFNGDASSGLGDMVASLFQPGGLAGYASMNQAASVSRMHHQTMQLQSQQRFAEQISMNSMRTQWITGQMTMAMTGLPLDQARTKHGWVDPMQRAAGRFLNSEMASPYFGGSDIDLAFGIQTAVGAAGMRINGAQVFGQGHVNNMISQQLFTDVSKRFMDNRGFLRRDLTANFDRTDMGQMFSLLGSQGAFSGMNVASLTAGASGNEFKLDEGASQKITGMIGQAARTFRLLKDIYSDRNFSELAQLAQGLTGTTLTQVGGNNAIRSRILSTVAAGEAHGMDARRAIEFDLGIVQQLTARGFAPSTAGAFGGIISPSAMQGSQYQLAQQNAFGGMGFHVTAAGAGQIGAGHINAASMLMRNHDAGILAVGRHVLETRTLTPADRSEIGALMASGNQPALSGKLSAIMGMSPSELLDLIPGGAQGLAATLSTSGQSGLASDIMGVARSRQRSFIGRNILSAQFIRPIMGSTPFDMEEVRAMMGSLQLDLSPDTTTKILGAAASGAGAGEIEALIRSDPAGAGFRDPGGLAKSIFNHRGSLPELVRSATRLQSAIPELSGFQRTADVMAAELARNVVLDTFADTTPALSGLRGFMAGALGMTVTSDNAAAQYIKLLSDRGDTTMAGAMGRFGPGMSSADAAQIMAFGGNKVFGSAAELIAAAAKDPKGTAAKLRLQGGMFTAEDSRAYDPEMIRRIQESNVLKTMGSVYAFNQLAGANTKDALTPLDDKTLEALRRAALGLDVSPEAKKLLEQHTGGGLLGTLTNQIMTSAGVRDEDFFRDLASTLGTQDKDTAVAAINNAIEQTRIKAATQEKKEDREKTEEQLEYLKRKRGELGGDNFLGYLEIMDLDKIVLRLIKTVEGGLKPTQ